MENDTLGGGAKLSYATEAPRLNQMTSGSRKLSDSCALKSALAANCVLAPDWDRASAKDSRDLPTNGLPRLSSLRGKGTESAGLRRPVIHFNRALVPGSVA